MLIILQKHNGTSIKIVTDNWPKAKLKKAFGPMDQIRSKNKFTMHTIVGYISLNPTIILQNQLLCQHTNSPS
jgi:hypothetical protein